MDESWRIPIGSVVPRRRSTEQSRRPPGGGGFGLDPDDFRDVFGGPPRTVLLRQFSGGDLTSPSSSYSTASYFDWLHRHHQPGPSRCRPSFYEEVFRQQPPETSGSREGKAGRSLPGFRIPSAAAEGGGGGEPRRRDEGGGFYDDIFGWEPERRSRTRSRQSKSNSSSVLSSEEQDGGEMVGPIRPWLADDGVLSSFASKLRPVNIPSRRCDAPSPTLPDEQISSHRTSTIRCPSTGLMELRFKERDSVTVQKVVDPCKRFGPFSPPETIIGVELKRPAATDDESDSDSPSSVVSSIYDIPMATIRPAWTHGKVAAPQAQVLEKGGAGEEEGELSSPYEIEIVPGQKAAETEGWTAVDEAIAWAKERSRSSPLEGIGVGREDQEHKSVTGRYGYARPLQEQRRHAL